MGRVAIVDDTIDTADFLAFLLRSRENEVTTFTDPRDFVARFTPGSYDLILLDLTMPNLHGLELFNLIRSKDRWVPVVAVTAQQAPSERRKALEAGFADFYLKPIVDTDAFRARMLELANPPDSRTA
jgi:CheY-like chemotaxis protein